MLAGPDFMKRRWFTTQRTTVDVLLFLPWSTAKLFAGTFTMALLLETAIFLMLPLLLLLLAPFPAPILLILVVKLHLSGR